jgi:hypothetical protein
MTRFRGQDLSRAAGPGRRGLFGALAAGLFGRRENFPVLSRCLYSRQKTLIVPDGFLLEPGRHVKGRRARFAGARFEISQFGSA